MCSKLKSLHSYGVINPDIDRQRNHEKRWICPCTSSASRGGGLTRNDAISSISLQLSHNTLTAVTTEMLDVYEHFSLYVSYNYWIKVCNVSVLLKWFNRNSQCGTINSLCLFACDLHLINYIYCHLECVFMHFWTLIGLRQTPAQSVPQASFILWQDTALK